MLSRYRLLLTAIFFFSVGGWPPTARLAYAGTPSFVYDNGNRLLAAFDGNGDVTNYQYDRMGNITAIITGSAANVAVFGYSPDHAPAGSPITIFGINFSPTASQNTVTIGGNPATVLSSTATTIVVTNPFPNGIEPFTVSCPAGYAFGPNFFAP